MASADVFNKGRLTLLLLVAHISCSREKGGMLQARSRAGESFPFSAGRVLE